MDFKFEIKEAKKEAIPPLVGLFGKSGSGKTYSALLLARGMVGEKGKIVLIDTENGRAKYYSDSKEIGKWFHLDMQPPFTPEKYSAALEFSEKQGADVTIFDSASHVWEELVLDAESARTKDGREMPGLAKWKDPKISHKRMLNKLIRTTKPVIFCLRSKDGVKQEGFGKDMKIIQLGEQPICERGFIYEMTIALHLTKDGMFDLNNSKAIPSPLRPYIKEGGKVGIDMGKSISKWANSGEEMDVEKIKKNSEAIEDDFKTKESLVAKGEETSKLGRNAYSSWISTLNDKQKDMVRNHHKLWSEIAKDVDSGNTKASINGVES